MTDMEWPVGKDFFTKPDVRGIVRDLDSGDGTLGLLSRGQRGWRLNQNFERDIVTLVNHPAMAMKEDVS